MPNNNTVARAYVQIVPSAEGIKGSITSALGGEASSAGQSIGGKLVNTIKGVIASAGIGAALGKALTEGGALQQSIGGVKTLFADSANEVIAAANNAYKTAGLSANDYMEQVTSFSATLLQGLGNDTQAAAKYSDQAIVQMADNANKMGTSMESIQYAYQGFAKDNYTMLDNLKLGYGGTQEEMARLINDSGVLGDAIEVTAKTVKDVPFSTIIDAIGVIQERLGIAGTAADEAATTLTGSFASVKAALDNVLGNLTIGQDLGPSLNALATTLTTFLTGNLIPAITNILSALPGALVTFITALGPQLATGLSTIVPQMMTAGAQMLQSLSAGLVQGIPNFLAQALPMILQFTTSLRANFSNIVDAGIDMLLDLVQGIANGLPTLIEYVPTIVSNIAGLINDNAPKILQAGIQIIITLVQGLINAIPTIIANIPQIIGAIADTITAFNWLNLGATVIKTIGNGLVSMAGALKGFMQSTLSGALDYLKSLPGQALQWGKDLIGGFIDGIIGNVGNLINSVKNVAATIASYLHFSRPDIGPLRDYETWMPDMMQGMASSLRANVYRLTDALDLVGNTMQKSLALDTTGLATRAIQQDAQVRREPRSAQRQARSQAITKDDLTALVGTIIQAIQNNGGPVIIGDETIYRSYNRARQSQSIMMGGVV